MLADSQTERDWDKVGDIGIPTHPLFFPSVNLSCVITNLLSKKQYFWQQVLWDLQTTA